MGKNILVIMADQLTAFGLNCYGTNYAITPNLDKLAATGLLFKNAYSSSPLCTPARYAFMTGQHVSAISGYDNASYLPSTVPTFAHYLRQMGYLTALAGKMHFVGSDQLHGFEERYTTDVYPADFGWVPDWKNPDKRIDLWYHNMSSIKQAGIASITNQLAYDDEVGAVSMRALYNYARSMQDKPFCLVSSFIHPHDPYAARQKYWDMYTNVDIPLPSCARPNPKDNDPHNLRLEKVIALGAVDVSEQEIINARRAYFANVTYVDEWVGRLIDTLEETGQRDNTTIIFTSDHGDMLGEYGLWYKMSFREWSSRIPLIVNDRDLSVGEVNFPVSQLDILPTLVDIAVSSSDKQTAPEVIDPLSGHSLIDIANNNAKYDSRVVAAEYLGEGLSEPMLMLRDKRYKYIQCKGDPDQLFDLYNDLSEITNLASNTDYSECTLAFKKLAGEHWNADELKQKVLVDQRRRRLVSSALHHGNYHSWDWNPIRDASQEYTRSHLELSAFDFESRFPRPPEFKPRWK